MTESTATLFIDGQWVPASDGATRTVTCPADQSEVGVVSEATGEDVERAILAARRAFESRVWADRPASERGDFLLRVADALQERKDEFARAEAFDTTVADALRRADIDVLGALDPDLATVLQAAGRAPWQVLAGALASTNLAGDLTYDAAPYGVGYFVATFT